MIASTDWVGIAQVIAAAFAVVAAIAIPLAAFGRRPRLQVLEETGWAHSRVEANGIPYIRLLVKNSRLRRTARQAQVIVHSYESGDDSDAVAMGHPSLGWTSVFNTDNSIAVVFPGAARPVDLGYLVPGWRGPFNEWMPDPEEDREATIKKRGHWEFQFTLANRLKIADDRDVLPPTPNGYVVRLIVGAEEGRAKSYEVDLNWEGDAPTSDVALKSVQVAIRNGSWRD